MWRKILTAAGSKRALIFWAALIVLGILFVALGLDKSSEGMVGL